MITIKVAAWNTTFLKTDTITGLTGVQLEGTPAQVDFANKILADWCDRHIKHTVLGEKPVEKLGELISLMSLSCSFWLDNRKWLNSSTDTIRGDLSLAVEAGADQAALQAWLSENWA